MHIYQECILSAINHTHLQHPPYQEVNLKLQAKQNIYLSKRNMLINEICDYLYWYRFYHRYKMAIPESVPSLILHGDSILPVLQSTCSHAVDLGKMSTNIMPHKTKLHISMFQITENLDKFNWLCTEIQDKITIYIYYRSIYVNSLHNN